MNSINWTYTSIGLALLLVLGGITLLGQVNQSDVQKKKEELGQLRSAIKESEVRLKRLEARARKSAAAAAESRKQAAHLDSLVTLLESREASIAGEMISVRSRRDSVERVREHMTDEYQRVARALYRRRLLAPTTTMLLMPEEHRRLALAEWLFERYARRQAEIASAIVSLRDSLDRKDSVLVVRRNEQLALLSDRRAQIEKLHTLEKRYAKEIRRAKSEKGTLEKFIQRKNAEAKQIEGMISRLIQKAEQQSKAAKRSSEKPASTNRSNKASTSTRTNKPQNKAKSDPVADSPAKQSSRSSFRAAWPVSGRKILHKYGERRNPRTKTITFNPGVNISAAKGSMVTAAASGEVSLVSWLPGYGTVVIVEHGGGWRTVYANLASASVSEGRSVRRGAVIGTVGESVDGEYLHFEIWQDQNRLDPMTKLKQ